ncbi:hypothetical protein [uncultured Dokdonia sp.]|uniref:hypothetical protein n=1 Tax=uncultured Dokdonia sp. TaxID=575653 RepID=UPI002606D0D0|nr:hypothetical protein [uncultured Dokdonia sp.]
MKKYFFTISLFCIVCISCNNDNNDTSVSQEGVGVEVEDAGFYNLRVGNSWTYEYFRRDEFGNPSSEFSTTGIIEEQEIIASQEINGEQIFTFQVTVSGVEESSSNFPAEDVATFQVKDSLGYLVRLNEGIIFSSENEQEYLRNDDLFEGVFGVLLNTQEAVEVPVGNFECAVNEVYAMLTQEGDLSLGRDEYLYAEGIGEVLYRISFVFTELHVFEQRLIDFSFQEQ